MHIEYDSEADAAFVWLVTRDELLPEAVAHEVWPSECGEKIGLLFNEEKQLIGLEVLSASEHLPPLTLQGEVVPKLGAT